MKIEKILLTFSAVALLLSGCKKFGDTNVNPNGTTNPSTAALLSNVETQLGGFSTQTRGGLYAQYFSETQYTEVSLYALPKLDFDGIYAGPLYDLQNIIIYNTDPDKIPLAAKFGSANNQIAIARILKAYIFWTVTDRWGDVPYFEAFKGKENLTPVFDKQEDIYKDLIKELTEAKDQFDDGEVASGDFIYGGDASHWKKLANTLRMLIALRTSDVYPDPGQWAATEFAAAYNDADGSFESNDDNLVLNYPGTSAFRNPWYNLYNGRTDFAESKLVVDFLTSYSDPRQAKFGSSNIGFPYGLTRPDAVAFGDANPTYAKITSTNSSTTAPATIIGFDHLVLALAEAAERGWIAEDPEFLYQYGIEASWERFGVTGDIDAYYANPKVDLTSGVGGTALQKIQFQQYLAYYPDGIQGWSNWRRTGIPILTPTPNATNSGGQIPRRYTYGSNAYSLNTGHTNEAVGRLPSGDTPDARVWWDKP